MNTNKFVHNSNLSCNNKSLQISIYDLFISSLSFCYGIELLQKFVIIFVTYITIDTDKLMLISSENYV